MTFPIQALLDAGEARAHVEHCLQRLATQVNAALANAAGDEIAEWDDVSSTVLDLHARTTLADELLCVALRQIDEA